MTCKIVCTQPIVHTMLKDSETLQFPARRTHRTYSSQFKAEMVSACAKPGASISALALAQGMNPNVLHRWLREHERDGLHQPGAVVASSPKTVAPAGGFIALALPASVAPGKSAMVEVELHKGDIHLVIRWPANQSAELANWTGALLR